MLAIWAAVFLSLPLFAAAGRKSCDAFLDPNQALRQLRKQIRNSDVNHTLRIKAGRGYLIIGEFKKRQRKFSAALLEAIASGGLADVDIGPIDHAKILYFLQKLIARLPEDNRTRLWGYFDPSSLLPEIETTSRELLSNVVDIRNDQFSRTESDKLSAAIEALGLREACARLYFTTDLHRCGLMKFTVTAPQSDSVRWEKAHVDEWFWEKAG